MQKSDDPGSGPEPLPAEGEPEARVVGAGSTGSVLALAPVATADTLSAAAALLGQQLASVALSTPALAPDQIDAASRESAREMVVGSTPANTLRAHASASKYLAAWYRLRFG